MINLALKHFIQSEPKANIVSGRQLSSRNSYFTKRKGLLQEHIFIYDTELDVFCLFFY